jgi:hypothetical protein
MGPSIESQVLNCVVRMVVPMRREFGRSLDVQRFLREPAYAQAVIEEALASRDLRLRDYALYVQRHLGGPRDVDAPPVPGTPAVVTGAPAGAAGGASPGAAVPSEPTEAELRERVLKKYTGGLR